MLDSSVIKGYWLFLMLEVGTGGNQTYLYAINEWLTFQWPCNVTHRQENSKYKLHVKEEWLLEKGSWN